MIDLGQAALTSAGCGNCMGAMKRGFYTLWVVLFGFLLSSCGSKVEPGIDRVVPYYLSEVRLPDRVSPMVRSEVLKRLHGAISPSEMRDRLGNYFTVSWSVENGELPVELVLIYQQAKTASKKHSVVQRVQASGGELQTSEFAIIGPEYQDRGPVIAWKVELRQGGQVLDSEQSFLWE